ncbi:MAG: hypothetical protein ALECFALPRED_000068 [Alectoria fallacina]|uniref:Uncharacterized protein n=1 Tax=Alectoria fallacina TaxID=1903189 RepID=A0A8H3HUI1_9LECA|nr:MAG: hypothetical protein ALECFALPRED_000068 [Alectoria fallacina]
MALFLVQYSTVTIEAPTQTLGGLSSVQSASDLEGQLSDLVIPQEEAKNVTTTETRSTRSAPDYATLLSEIGDFTLPSNITAGHVAKAAKQAVPSLSDAEVISIVQALRPEQLSLLR